MGGDVPKQFLPLGGKPVIVHTVERFMEALPGANIIVVLPQEELGRWKEIAEEYAAGSKVRVCSGGDTRFASVKKALSLAGDADLIGVHDGVRPFITGKIILDSLETAVNHGASVPAVEPADSFRIVEGGESRVLDRSKLRLVQTPQFFRADILKEAYKAEYTPEFTDDASVVEKAGYKINLSRGDTWNIKITTPADFAVAQALFENRIKE